MKRQRHSRERRGEVRKVWVLVPEEGQERAFRSRDALLQWARKEARRAFPEENAPVARLTRRQQLFLHPSKQDYERWIARPKSVRNLDRGPAVLFGKVHLSSSRNPDPGRSPEPRSDENAGAQPGMP